VLVLVVFVDSPQPLATIASPTNRHMVGDLTIGVHTKRCRSFWLHRGTRDVAL
jgi:hypothetical protein